MKDVLFFDRMLTPNIITFVYWLGLIAVVISSLGMMTGIGGMEGGGFIQGVITLVVGVVAVRIWCELLIVMFKIHENLRSLVDIKRND